MREASVRWNPIWFYRRVRRGGPWDFRQLTDGYRDFSNFHYAATGIAFGFPAWCLHRGAGWEHWWSGRSERGWGYPWSAAPYGDRPEDQAMIAQGIAYAQACGYWQGIGGRLFWRAFDIVVGAIGLIAFGPFTGLFAFLTVLNSGWPPFDGSYRLGRYGKPFRCWKIRTLSVKHQRVLRKHLLEYPLAQHEWEIRAKLFDDPRVTRLGRILRKLSLDDIGPQFWNILMGDMAFFGPRAFMVSESGRLSRYEETILSVKPGWVSYYGAYGRATMPVAVRVRLEARFVRRMHLLGVKWHALVGTVKHCVMRTGAG